MTSSYWQERSRLNKLRVLHLGERFIDELKKVLKGNLDDIDKEIKSFYDKYGDNPAEKLSYEEFQKYKANLIKKAKKYPKDKILQKQAKQDIPKYKIDRLRQLETDLQIKFASVTATQETAIKSDLTAIALISNKTTMEMIKKGLGLNLGGVSARKIKQVVMTDWVGGKNWSERIWDDREKLGQNVKKIMTQGTVRGFGYKKMATTLKDNISSSFNNAFRLIRTEGAYIQAMATLESYKETQERLGEKLRYSYDAFLEDRTSSICKELNNKTFWVDDAVVGENFPPMHPNCRSTTQLVLDSDDIKEERSNNPEKAESSSKKGSSENEKPVLVETGKQKKGSKIPAKYKTFKTGEDANSAFYYDDEKRGLLAKKNSLYGQWQKSLSSDEKEAISAYAGSYYQDINDHLRGIVDLSADKNIPTIVKDLDSTISKFPLNKDITVFRGVNVDAVENLLKENKISKYSDLVGKTYKDNGYMSTSAIKNIEQFGSKKVQMELQIPKGIGKGAYINELSGFTDEEYEFLIKRGSEFEILEVKEDNIYGDITFKMRLKD